MPAPMPTTARRERQQRARSHLVPAYDLTRVESRVVEALNLMTGAAEIARGLRARGEMDAYDHARIVEAVHVLEQLHEQVGSSAAVALGAGVGERSMPMDTRRA